MIPCACWIETEERGGRGRLRILYCSMHAAAPDLLEALMRVMAECEVHGMGCASYIRGQDCNCSRREAAAAIAKAEGKP